MPGAEATSAPYTSTIQDVHIRTLLPSARGVPLRANKQWSGCTQGGCSCPNMQVGDTLPLSTINTLRLLLCVCERARPSRIGPSTHATSNRMAVVETERRRNDANVLPLNATPTRKRTETFCLNARAFVVSAITAASDAHLNDSCRLRKECELHRQIIQHTLSTISILQDISCCADISVIICCENVQKISSYARCLSTFASVEELFVLSHSQYTAMRNVNCLVSTLTIQ